MPQVFHLGGGSSNFGLDSHLHRVQLGNGSERVVVQMNANGHIEFSNPVTGNAVSFPFETMYGNVGLEMNGVMSSDSYIGIGKAPSNDDETSNTTNDSASTSTEVSFYPTGMNAADNLSNYPGFTNAMYFNGSDDYLSRTISNNNGSTYTFSVWLKRNPSTGGNVLTAGNVTGSIHYHYFSFSEIMANTHYPDFGPGPMWLHSEAKFTDSNAWYHAVWVVDCGNSVAEDRQKFYVNGERITSFGFSTFPSITSATPGYINSTYSENRIGRAPNGHDGYYNGYMANIQMIDGQALDATDFGQYMVDSNGNTTSAWVPKLYDGDYGTNGFLLDFSSLELNGSGEIIQVNDTAPKSDGQSPNNWTAH